MVFGGFRGARGLLHTQRTHWDTTGESWPAVGLSDPRGFVSDLGLNFFALGAGSALSLVRLLIACLRNCYKIFRLMPGFCCLVVAEGCRLT